MVKSVQRRASLGSEEGGEHPSLHPTEGYGQGGWCPTAASPLLEPPPAPQHSLHQPLGPVAAQVVGHGVGAVERGFDVEAAQVPRVGLVEVEGDAGNVDPPRGLAGQAQLVARCLGQSGTGVSHPPGPISPSTLGTSQLGITEW